ncbi:hypothetical protein BDB01DRAFT_779270 [Pilobolus umbonatus]|nr:hypothetical protein BDB01DRAFT_779270 [Pilobolus umbonatus]
MDIEIPSLIFHPSIILTMTSTLSSNDRTFMEFARCLYKAKSVVLELEAFSQTVGPILCLSRYDQEQQYDPRISPQEFIKRVNEYLNVSFRRFNHMCKILLIVLKKLEFNQSIARERIDSFREEVINEWKKANVIKLNLMLIIKKRKEKGCYFDSNYHGVLSTSLSPQLLHSIEACLNLGEGDDDFSSNSETSTELNSSE